jgi:hypothetical protein
MFHAYGTIGRPSASTQPGSADELGAATAVGPAILLAR